MLATKKPLSDLTAADLMSRQVVVIPQAMSLRAAARLLSRSGISGAPVVDEGGECVGVISAMDFIHWAEDKDKARECGGRTGCVCADWQVVEMDSLPDDVVANYMTADPVTAPPSAGVRDLAWMMMDAHIHRVVIVDGNLRPVGVVSSTDVLAAVAYDR
jgi:CBS-domain-containing membrane protein